MEDTDNKNLIHWHCQKCKIRIAVVDTIEKELRLRYKDLVIKFTWSDEHGEQDKISVLCRRCAWNNELTRKQLKNNTIDTIEKK